MAETTTTNNARRGCWSDAVAGGIRRIPLHQLALAWWCYQEHRITPRQFRVYMALHEMHERRRAAGKAEKGRYGVAEMRRLIGGERITDHELRQDCDQLRTCGLAEVAGVSIRFVSVAADAMSGQGFDTFLKALPNNRRTVPVPRRVIRLLAGGLPRAVAATLIAMLIRGMFWQREHAKHRIDGRVKAKWIADQFGLSLRAVKEARQRLEQLGWISILPAAQWERNRWGLHYAINVDWVPPGESAPPRNENPVESAPPDQTVHLLKENNLRNRNPARAAERPVAYQEAIADSDAPPKLTDLQPGDLSKFHRVNALYEQAVEKGLAGPGDAGRLDFFALAGRAVTHGKEPLKLFSWLLHRKRFDVISDADEDAADRWIKHHVWDHRSRPSTTDDDESYEQPIERRPAWMPAPELDDAIPY